MTKAIDRDKLLEWLEEQIDDENERWVVETSEKAFRTIRNMIYDGAFDLHDTDTIGELDNYMRMMNARNERLERQLKIALEALERIAVVDVFDWSDETFQGCVNIARQAIQEIKREEA